MKGKAIFYRDGKPVEYDGIETTYHKFPEWTKKNIIVDVYSKDSPEIVAEKTNAAINGIRF